nr:hypothetical protein Iba_chr08eCG6420 [Ipomoea batatas]
MVRARCSPREQEQGAHPGSKVPGYRSSDLNGESKVLTPGARCPVTGLRTLMQGAHPGSKVPGYRSSDLNGESKVLTPGARCPVTGLRTLMVFPDRSSGDGSQNGFSGLSASADVTGEQDGVVEDLLSQVRTLQDSASGLLGCLELAFELLDPLVPLSQGLLEWRHLSTVYFVPVFGPGEEIGNGVGHLQDYELAVEVDNANADTSITGVVDPDPSRRVRFAGATSSTSTSFSFSFPCLAARVSPWSPLGSEACVAVKGSPAGTRASALGASVLGSADLADPAFLDPRLIFFTGAGGRAETGKLLMAPENQKTGKVNS